MIKAKANLTAVLLGFSFVRFVADFSAELADLIDAALLMSLERVAMSWQNRPGAWSRGFGVGPAAFGEAVGSTFWLGREILVG
jgi:hypothetical protein